MKMVLMVTFKGDIRAELKKHCSPKDYRLNADGNTEHAIRFKINPGGFMYSEDEFHRMTERSVLHALEPANAIAHEWVTHFFT